MIESGRFENGLAKVTALGSGPPTIKQSASTTSPFCQPPLSLAWRRRVGTVEGHNGHLDVAFLADPAALVLSYATLFVIPPPPASSPQTGPTRSREIAAAYTDACVQVHAGIPFALVTVNAIDGVTFSVRVSQYSEGLPGG